jgi:hypothetical protein
MLSNPHGAGPSAAGAAMGTVARPPGSPPGSLGRHLRGAMSAFKRLILVSTLVVVLGGVIFLVTWDIPPPTTTIERVIPDDRLPR